ncbi:CAP family protein [Rhodotorula paludigena]|uniref:CAP family protein n=1 Tax=Rhodotorula paludigena TaxID=86838 RepID=UPI0031774D22
MPTLQLNAPHAQADHRTLYLLILLAVVLIACLAFLIWLSKRSYSKNSFSSSSTAASISSTFTSDCLAAHNDFRATHHAEPLEWNETLARSSERWAKNCVWEHSKDLIPGGYGENLYAVASTAYTPESTEPLNASDGIWVWNHEESMYSYGPPPTGFTHETGHFTQTVWRATRSVGCFMQMCKGVIGGGDYGAYLVCQYFPPGNVGSADLSTYIENVQAPG